MSDGLGVEQELSHCMCSALDRVVSRYGKADDIKNVMKAFIIQISISGYQAIFD